MTKRVYNIIQIDRGVPLPPSMMGEGPRPNRFPWRDMKIGDSFWVNACNRAAVTSNGAKITGWKFVSRTEGGGFRVWRIE